MELLVQTLLALLSSGSTQAQTTLEIDIHGLRNDRGVVHLCATKKREHFPDCRADPQAYRQSVPATSHQFRLTGIDPGRYAVSIFHDQNSNAKLDTFLGVPREGFGFSRNPVIRFGAPKFDSVGIELVPGFTRTVVRMQYLL